MSIPKDPNEAVGGPRMDRPLNGLAAANAVLADEMKKEIGDREPVQLLVDPKYKPLFNILMKAVDQSASGKGHERHSTGQSFLEQPIMTISRRYGVGFALGQAEKKMQESLRLPHDLAEAEMLGAIVYLAAAIQLKREEAGL